MSCGSHASLACLDSQEEHDFVSQLMAATGHARVWLGLYEPASCSATDGSLQGPDGCLQIECSSGKATTWRHWDPLQLRRDTYHEHCVSTSGAGWMSDLCGNELPCLCEHGQPTSADYMARLDVQAELQWTPLTQPAQSSMTARDVALEITAAVIVIGILVTLIGFTCCQARRGAPPVWQFGTTVQIDPASSCEAAASSEPSAASEGGYDMRPIDMPGIELQEKPPAVVEQR